MYRIFYAEKDNTLYERFSEQNAGIDEIIELSKIASGSRVNGVIRDNTYNSRMLVDFGSAITTISQSIEDGEVTGNPRFYLNLHASEATDILTEYTVKAYPVSQSWENGNGQLDDRPATKIGSSWKHRSGDAVAQTTTSWLTGSNGWYPGVTETLGGGTWITGSGFEASQSFVNESPDIRMDVTDIVLGWVSGSMPNYGFLIKRPNSDEISGENLGSIKYFGKESHTIFVPKLEMGYDDSSTSGTLSAISSNTYVPYFKNIRAEYRTDDIVRFRIGVRPEFPAKSYQTSSFYLTNDHLPASSSYSICDSVTNDIFIYDDNNWADSNTKISYDTDGSYFDLRMDSFMPERYYKIKLKCIRSNDTQTFDDFYFKVVR